MDSVKVMNLSFAWGNELTEILKRIQDFKGVLDTELGKWNALSQEEQQAIINFFVGLGGSETDITGKIQVIQQISDYIASVS